jgi:hypothetical protein
MKTQSRHRPEGGRRSLGRDQGNAVADAQAHLQRQTVADHHRVAAGEVVERAGDDVVGDERPAAQVLGSDSAHQGAGGDPAGGGHHLALDHGRDQDDALDPADHAGEGVELGQRRPAAMDDDVTAQTQDAAQQLMAEAVHHRHDDDQGRDPEGDAEQGKGGDHRDEAFLPARPQIAPRHHPFEGGEHAASDSQSV